MDTPVKLYGQKYGQLISGFLAVSALVSLILLGSILAIEYTPLESHDTSSRIEVQRVAYGSRVETTNEERASDPEFQKCFIELENGIVFEEPQLGCEVKAGDSVNVFAKASGEERLEPRYFQGTVFALQLYMTLALSLLLGSLFSLTLFTMKRITINKEASNALRL